jgi:L-ascorbate metabolism protein UlaG (beta-lactamase superfamily)
MQASPQWSGTGFQNAQPIAAGLRDPNVRRPTLWKFLRADATRRPARPLPTCNPLATWRHAPGSALRVTWLGHSTTLLELDGVRILTDPVWGARASPLPALGPKRFQPVPIALGALPPVDLVIISHDHYDHLDYPTIRVLARSGVPFLTPLGVGAHLEAWGVAAARITELDWWEHHDLPATGVRITATPSQHFSGRTPKSRNATLWASFVVRSPRACVFFSGDTGLTRQYESIGARCGPFDLVMLEIGGWHPAWGEMHLGPEHALEALTLLGGGPFLPVHWGTFSLAMHAWDQPVETLLQRRTDSAAPLLLPRIGEPVEPAHAPDRIEPWWRVAHASTPAAADGAARRKHRHALFWPPD